MLDLHINTKVKCLPNLKQFQRWVNLVLAHEQVNSRVTLYIVDKAESQHFNRHYRGNNKSTNVLAFRPAETIVKLAPFLLGDLILCAPLIQQEASKQGKQPLAHWAHLVIHGTLHLLAYDHVQTEAAIAMEALECQLLAKLGIANPYAEAT